MCPLHGIIILCYITQLIIIIISTRNNYVKYLRNNKAIFVAIYFRNNITQASIGAKIKKCVTYVIKNTFSFVFVKYSPDKIFAILNS